MVSYMPNSNEFVREISIDEVANPYERTINSKLTGTVNTRTLIKPTIVPPAYDIDSWKTNPAVFHSQINKKTIKNLSRSGLRDYNREVYSLPDCTTNSTPSIETWSQSNFVPLQPSIYTATDSFQPINSSLGISYSPTFPDTTDEYNNNYEEQIFIDTTNNTSFVKAKPSSFSSGPDGVYDPRFTGYGDEDRTYFDNSQGINKYYYDDINAVRMPNYITRNKVDSSLTSFGDSYGKLSSGHMSLSEVRPRAEQCWMQNSIDFRTNLSKSLMRKKNEEMVQRRQAPKYTLF